MTCVAISCVYRPKSKQQLQFRKIVLFRNHKARNAEFERHHASRIKHKLGKPPRVCERQMARIEFCRLPFSLWSSSLAFTTMKYITQKQ